MENDGRLSNYDYQLKRLATIVGQMTSSSNMDNARRGEMTAATAETTIFATVAQRVIPVASQAAITPTVAGGTYSATEQAMLDAHDALLVKITDTLRALGAWTDP